MNLIGWKPRVLDPRVASTRIRVLNPVAELRSYGYPVELFDSRHVHTYSVVIYSKLYDDATYREATFLKKRGVRIALDLCDNHFYNPNGLASLHTTATQLRRMMEEADTLVASTHTLAELMRAELSVPRNITVIEDAVETEIFGNNNLLWKRWWQNRKLIQLRRQLQEDRSNGKTPLVWFGIHGGANADYGMLDLLKLRPILEQINRRHAVTLTVISNSRRKYNKVIKSWPLPTYYLEWHPDTVMSALRSHTIAVIPISDNPFTRCKSNNRLTFALNAGLAVVADAIPSYHYFSDACFLNNWESGLERYLTDVEMRRRHIQLGKAIIARDWTIARIAQKWRSFFDSLMGPNAKMKGCGLQASGAES